MTTLIILVIFFAIAIIGLIIISIKKFSDKTDYILASNAIVSNNITDIGTANKTIMDSMDVSNRALINSINAIEEKLSTTPTTEDIIDSDELVNRIVEQLYNKINDFQAKNSSSTNKTEKPSPAKSKQRTKARKANNSYNSVHDPLQEK